LEELLDKLRGLADYPLAPTSEWIKTEKSKLSMPTPTPTAACPQDGGPHPRSLQIEKQRKELSDDTFTAESAAAATINAPKTPTVPEEETTPEDAYYENPIMTLVMMLIIKSPIMTPLMP
jgi:hypothetical protein